MTVLVVSNNLTADTEDFGGWKFTRWDSTDELTRDDLEMYDACMLDFTGLNTDIRFSNKWNWFGDNLDYVLNKYKITMLVICGTENFEFEYEIITEGKIEGTLSVKLYDLFRIFGDSFKTTNFPPNTELHINEGVIDEIRNYLADTAIRDKPKVAFKLKGQNNNAFSHSGGHKKHPSSFEGKYGTSFLVFLPGYICSSEFNSKICTYMAQIIKVYQKHHENSILPVKINLNETTPLFNTFIEWYDSIDYSEFENQLFISYPRKNFSIADNIYSKIEEIAMKPYMDKSDIPSGSVWEEELKEAMQKSQQFLLVLTKNTISSQAMWEYDFFYDKCYGTSDQRKILVYDVENIDQKTLPEKISKLEFETDIDKLIREIQIHYIEKLKKNIEKLELSIKDLNSKMIESKIKLDR